MYPDDGCYDSVHHLRIRMRGEDQRSAMQLKFSWIAAPAQPGAQ
jgi:hypothetical protein